MGKTEVQVSRHGYSRAKQRLGWKKGTTLKMAIKAFYEGHRYPETKGKLRRYVDQKIYLHQDCANIRLYGEVFFAFRGKKLITLYRLPQELTKYVNKLHHEENKKCA